MKILKIDKNQFIIDKNVKIRLIIVKNRFTIK